MKSATRPGLACPDCGGGLRLLYTRQRVGHVYRRRECLACRQRYSTSERLINRGTGERSVAVPLLLSSVHDLLASLGISDAALENPVTLPSKETHP